MPKVEDGDFQGLLNAVNPQPVRKDKLMVSYDMLPEHMREPARQYIEEGHPVGDFLVAVLRNSFTATIGRADHINIHYLKEWARWLHNEVPMDAWGSHTKVAEWMEKGGLNG